jgi:hypothetical protein
VPLGGFLLAQVGWHQSTGLCRCRFHGLNLEKKIKKVTEGSEKLEGVREKLFERLKAGFLHPEIRKSEISRKATQPRVLIGACEVGRREQGGQTLTAVSQ